MRQVRLEIEGLFDTIEWPDKSRIEPGAPWRIVKRFKNGQFREAVRFFMTLKRRRSIKQKIFLSDYAGEISIGLRRRDLHRTRGGEGAMNLWEGVDQKTYRLFLRYHEQNPRIWGQFKQYAFQMMQAGRKKGSAKEIMERVRWEENLTRSEDQDFKINNDFTSLYARKFIEKFPEAGGFFEFRKVSGLKRAA